jgi:Tfp pilus assembly protein PilF
VKGETLGWTENKTQVHDRSALFVRMITAAEQAGDDAKAERLALEWLRADRDNDVPYRRLAAMRLKRGDKPGVLEISVRAGARIPASASLLALAGELCERAGDLEGALRYESLRAEIPDQRRDCMRRISRLRMKNGDTEGARTALAEVAAASGETAEAMNQAFAENAAASAEVRAEVGDLEGALDRVEAGLESRPNDAALLKLGAKFANSLGDIERALRYCLARAEIAGERGDGLVEEAKLRLKIYDFAGVRSALDGAIAAGVPVQRLRLLFVDLAILERDPDAGLVALEAYEAEEGPTQKSQALRIKLQKRGGKGSENDVPIRLKSTSTEELRIWAEQIGAPTLDVAAAAQKFITPAGDVMIERAQGSRAIVLVFGGLASLFGGAAEDLGFLAQERRVNALFLTDPQRLFLLNGLTSIGDYKATLAWIKELARAWDAPNLYCLGFSAGGYPAIRYGADLPARRVLTFAAPTNFAPGITKIETRGIALLNRILTRKPDMCENLRDYLALLGAGAPEIINYYGELMPQDAYHGRNIEGLPTVSSRPLAGVDAHGVIMHTLKKKGQYQEVLAEFLRDSDAQSEG